MASLSFSSITKQVAEHLRGGSMAGGRHNARPKPAAEDLGVSRKTVKGAQLQEAQGVLARQAPDAPSHRRCSSGVPGLWDRSVYHDPIERWRAT